MKPLKNIIVKQGNGKHDHSTAICLINKDSGEVIGEMFGESHSISEGRAMENAQRIAEAFNNAKIEDKKPLTFKEFMKSKREKSAEMFSKHAGIPEDSFTGEKVFVYMDGYYIDIIGKGKYSLVLGNHEYVTGGKMNPKTTLETLEKALFEYVKNEM